MGKIIRPGENPRQTVNIVGDRAKEIASAVLSFTVKSLVNQCGDIPNLPDEKKLRYFWSVVNSLGNMLDPRWIRTYENAVNGVMKDVSEAAKQFTKEQEKGEGEESGTAPGPEGAPLSRNQEA